MDIVTMHRKGLKQRAIARKLGISRNTVKKYIDNPELAFESSKSRNRKSRLDPFTDNIKAWIEEDSEYTATWIYDRLTNLGFVGSYEIVKRRVRRLKENYHKVAYMRFETEPGYQAQVDFGEFRVSKPNGRVEKLYLFSMILGYTPINREECNLFFRFIANRYEKASTVITSNKAFSDWAELFHDPIIVTAILDRLLHHSVVINIKGNSYRLRGKVKEKHENEVQKMN